MKVRGIIIIGIWKNETDVIMENEKQQIALRFKGEDYKESAKVLQAEGFQPLGFNEWYSPTTGNRYRFMMADGGKYITRVEHVYEEGTHLIRTEFCDQKLAIKRFNLENAKPTPVTDDEVKQGVIHALFNFSPSQFTKMLQRASQEGDAYTEMLYSRLGVEKGGRISVKQFLFVNDGTGFEAIAEYSEHKRYDRELLHTLAVGSKKLYFYRAYRLPEDMLDSLLCRVRLEAMIGCEEVQKLRLS